VAEIIAAGDFNCRIDCRFYNIFLDFVFGNKFVCCDMSRLSSTFAFNSDLSRVSWIDRVVTYALLMLTKHGSV